jgi:hypothetical protein
MWPRIDYCTFGNSNPFRIRIVNRFNDNYDHYYVKTEDASRIYGLELEHILSPNRITFFTGNSQTELLHHLGLESEVIAITKFCTHPTNGLTQNGGSAAQNSKYSKDKSAAAPINYCQQGRKYREQVEELA